MILVSIVWSLFTLKSASKPKLVSTPWLHIPLPARKQKILLPPNKHILKNFMKLAHPECVHPLLLSAEVNVSTNWYKNLDDLNRRKAGPIITQYTTESIPKTHLHTTFLLFSLPCFQFYWWIQAKRLYNNKKCTKSFPYLTSFISIKPQALMPRWPL